MFGDGDFRAFNPQSLVGQEKNEEGRTWRAAIWRGEIYLVLFKDQNIQEIKGN